MKSCIIVDAYRFSKDYIRYFTTKAIGCIHVQSSQSSIPDLAKLSTYDPNEYIANFIYDGRFESLLVKLRQLSPIAVIAGMESGVMLADMLSDALKINSNDFEKSRARRNKYFMAEVLKAANVPCMKYTNVVDSAQAIEWINKNTSYPVVIKPLESAGTDNVYICQTESAVIKNLKNIIGKNNCLGIPNESALLQEFLGGTEYMINSVSLYGKHYFTDIWRCNKRYVKDLGMIYDREELLESNGPIQNQITSYLTDAHNALGIKFGAAHSEIMLTQNGPILIETGARVGGNVNCVSHDECLGLNQLELNVDSYVDKELFLQKTQNPYHVLKSAMTILLSTQQEGLIESIPFIETVEACSSLYWYQLNVQPGDYLKPTHDLFSSPGKIILIHEDKNVIEQDYNALMNAILNGFKIKERSL